MKISEEKLKEILLESGFVSEKNFEEAVKTAHDLDKTVIDVLLEKGFVLERYLGQTIAEYFGFPYADLKSLTIPQEVLNLITEELAEQKRIAAFKREDDKLYLAMEDINDLETIELVKKKTDLEIEPFFTLPSVLNYALGQYQIDLEKKFEDMIAENVIEAKRRGVASGEELPVIKIIDSILKYATSEQSSDIHIESLGDKVIVRFRVFGELKDVLELPIEIHAALITRIKILSKLKTDEHRVPQDGRFRFQYLQDEISVRVSVLPSYYGENIQLRLLSAAARPKTLEDLGLTGRNLKVVQKSIQEPNGMILATGPTGCGKTTTLYNIVNILNTADVKIITIEDPIEYGIRRVNQIQINPQTGLIFASGLRSILRHDPDIILVGEIRDKETAEIAVHAALTGHLLLSSLHTNDAVSAIPRLFDLGIEPYLVGSTLNLVITQRLVARLCQKCLESVSLSGDALENLERFSRDGKLPEMFRKETVTVYRGKGCEACNQTGFYGRIGIFEVLEVSDYIRKLIFDKASIQIIEETAKNEGFRLMFMDGLDKVAAGLTTIEEVLEAVKE